MAELYGWMGKILRVDLTTGKISTVDTTKYVPKYVGGAGVANRIAWEEIPRGTGAFDPENKIIITNGPLTGTPAPTSGRGVVCGVAAQAYPEMYTHSGFGGWFPAELKYAGFDGIIIQGKAASPCYLWIHDGEAEIKDAGVMWGMGTYHTQHELKVAHGEDVRSLCIGPAGENKSRIAVLLTDTTNAAGQGGFGAVAGDKNLKAICVKGTQSVKIAHPEELMNVFAELQAAKSSPKKNPVLAKEYYGQDNPRCKKHFIGCSHACYRWCMKQFRDAERKTRPGVHSGGVECVGPLTFLWESQHGQGRHPVWPLWEQTFEGGFEATELLNEYGLNEWEILAGMVPWLVMGNRMGVITEDLYGGPINPDEAEWWPKFTHMLAYREGFGDLLAEGVTRAINTLGKEKFGETMYTGTRLCGREDDPKDRTLQVDTPISLQEAWGMAGHHSGRGIHGHRYFPIWLWRALCWLTESRDPHASHHIKNSKAWEEELTKDPYLGAMGPAVSYWNEIHGQLKDALTSCDWAFPIPDGPFPGVTGGLSDGQARLFSAVTGIDTTEQELDKMGLRITDMYRAIQIRNYDRTRELEWNEVVPFFRRPDATTGTAIDEDKFAIMVDNYYELHGWDKATGWPTRASLEDLDLKDVADELGAIGKLP